MRIFVYFFLHSQFKDQIFMHRKSYKSMDERVEMCDARNSCERCIGCRQYIIYPLIENIYEDS